MAYITSFDQSNKADWAFDVQATDAETGEQIDFTGAEIAFVVKDQNGCEKIRARETDYITISTTTISVLIDDSTMTNICAGSYNCGMVYRLNDETNQIFVGTVTVFDGVAKL